MSNYKIIISILVTALLLTFFFNISCSNASYIPDLTITRVSHYDVWSSGLDKNGFPYQYHKLVPGYTVTVYNGGTGASQNTTLNFYIKTFDNKTLVKYIKVPAMNPGQTKRISFSMNAGTDGSFKEGYVIINHLNTFKEVSYKNNIRKFGLQELMLKNSTKNVTEIYQVAGSPITWNSTTNNYTSPLSGKTGITSLDCKINFGDHDVDILNITVPIPGYLHNNVTMTASGDQFKSSSPTSWNDTSCTYKIDSYFGTLNYIEIKVVGDNLESKNVFKEPIHVIQQKWEPYKEEWIYSDIAAGKTRIIQEVYTGTTLKNASYYGTSFNYNVHHNNVVSIIVKGDNRGLYTAGWFITPLNSASKVTALFGDNKLPANLVSNGCYGINHRMRDVSYIGFEINGTNLQGFNNFKSLGFNSWTWQSNS
ncbi:MULTISPECIES: CARDB domain-containing protein [Methanobacterium]|uniref:CARDB domain-containing protein n=1 Tax=Methanobacterium veterum TaxID=408577 RepID=A0A9E5A4Z2_9EURY|nr:MULTISPECIES: CARDB domain-containing protein [Methanobacterium]MCZ3367272.1 hypothetical protein [Methanobacterium veterum]MCZ3373580.1 hypothetical protein [Methanobacterium veterum]